MWFFLLEGFEVKIVVERVLKEENFVVVYGNMFEVRGDEGSVKFDREVRLCFLWEEEKDFEEGVRRLGDVLKRIWSGEDGSGFGNGVNVELFK